ncbi:hypothetical protein QBC47DRAFT_147352 [Echria macrotheca]|uniref:Uncharacterized protein n=1 Tax=Echria macrotheca TaxID=438768 RepID=A0AAJ0BIK6_9PEZI|nr:hypothetical protein QBC47DRAFT_147352 [Echria macrotheca]
MNPADGVHIHVGLGRGGVASIFIPSLCLSLPPYPGSSSKTLPRGWFGESRLLGSGVSQPRSSLSLSLSQLGMSGAGRLRRVDSDWACWRPAVFFVSSEIATVYETHSTTVVVEKKEVSVGLTWLKRDEHAPDSDQAESLGPNRFSVLFLQPPPPQHGKDQAVPRGENESLGLVQIRAWSRVCIASACRLRRWSLAKGGCWPDVSPHGLAGGSLDATPWSTVYGEHMAQPPESVGFGACLSC